jgi:hypothetical protein
MEKTCKKGHYKKGFFVVVQSSKKKDLKTQNFNIFKLFLVFFCILKILFFLNKVFF